MIVLDTNVVSEVLRDGGDPVVRAWMDRQERSNLFLTATVAAELLVGVEQMPSGQRRNTLHTRVRALIDEVFLERVLPFDLAAAELYASRVAAARTVGQAIALGDGQIAATAISRGYAVATRDAAPFEAAGVQVINPWLTA